MSRFAQYEPHRPALSAALVLAIVGAATVPPARAENIILARQTNKAPTGAAQADDGPPAARPRDCAATYHRGLAEVREIAGTRLKDAVRRIRKGDHTLPGHWLFWRPEVAAIRRKLARANVQSSVIVIEDRICTRTVIGRGGLIRCLKWEAKPAGFKPPPPAPLTTKTVEPLASKAELKALRGLTTFVRSRGVIGAFDRPGRHYQLTKRVLGEIRGYLKQPPRPTICTGAQEMLDFYQRQLAPLARLSKPVETMADTAQQSARQSVAVALDAWQTKSHHAVTAVQTDLPSDSAVPVDLTRVPGSELDMITATAKVMLMRRHIGYIEAETTVFDRLVRAREAMSADAAKEPPDYVREPVFRAFRAIEIAHYARLRQQRYSVYTDALFGLLTAIRRQHEASCTCDR